MNHDDEPEERHERATGYRRHDTQLHGIVMLRAMEACRTAVGAYISSYRRSSQKTFAKTAGISVSELRAIEHGLPVGNRELKAMTEATLGTIDSETAKELRRLYRALSRCVSLFEQGDDDEADDDENA